jgi:hypothetical protein
LTATWLCARIDGRKEPKMSPKETCLHRFLVAPFATWPVRVTRAADSPWLKELYDLFAPVRAEAARYSEEEVDRDIKRAVAAVREKTCSNQGSTPE